MKQEREGAGLTRAELARAVGVHESVIGKIERGKSALTAERAKLIALALRIPIGRLFGEESAPEAA